MRDGYLEINGLQADFRFVRGHTYDVDMAWVETATGESWVKQSDLRWDFKCRDDKCRCATPKKGTNDESDSWLEPAN